MSDITGFGTALAAARRAAGLTQSDLAHRAGTSQSAVARIEQGSTSPTLATVSRLAAAAGLAVRLELEPHAAPDPVIEAYKRDVDRSLLRENLRKTVDERIRMLAELQEFGAEVHRAVRGSRGRS